MAPHLVLASGSPTRARLLRAAGLEIEVAVPRLDEAALHAAFRAEGTSPRDVADALAEAKAGRMAQRHPDALVLGCDQTAELDGALVTKPADPGDARAQLAAMSGRTHRLHSAAVIFEDGRPVWRVVDTVRMQVRQLSPGYVDAYVDRNWNSIRDSVGGYRLEEEGARLFTALQGDYFTVLGLPLLQVLSYLVTRGVIAA